MQKEAGSLLSGRRQGVSIDSGWRMHAWIHCIYWFVTRPRLTPERKVDPIDHHRWIRQARRAAGDGTAIWGAPAGPPASVRLRCACAAAVADAARVPRSAHSRSDVRDEHQGGEALGRGRLPLQPQRVAPGAMHELQAGGTERGACEGWHEGG